MALSKPNHLEIAPSHKRSFDVRHIEGCAEVSSPGVHKFNRKKQDECLSHKRYWLKVEAYNYRRREISCSLQRGL